MQFSCPAFLTCLLISGVHCSEASGEMQTATTVQDLEATLADYLGSIAHFQSHVDVTKVVRLSSGRVSEKTFHVECLMKDKVLRVAQYSHGSIEGERAWYDVRQSLVFSDRRTAEWRHPGFPGQLTFGTLSSEAGRIRYTAIAVGDPLHSVKRILRNLQKGRTQISDETSDLVIARSAVADPGDDPEGRLQDDYIEIRFSREFGNLPVSMTRVCAVDDPERTYQSGANIRIRYSRDANGVIKPVSIAEDCRLKDDVKGTLAMTLKIRSFEFRQPTMDQMKLVVPHRVMAVEADSGRQLVLNDHTDEDFQTVKAFLGDYIELRPKNEAKRIAARSFVGQCPDLPREYRVLRNLPEPRIPQVQRHAPFSAGLILHAVGVLAVGTVLLLRRGRRNSA